MKKQTAVEWLEQQFNNTFYVAEFGEMGKRFTKIFEQAKEMEREQIKESYKAGFNYRDSFNWEGDAPYESKEDLEGNEKEFDRYYNEIYKGGEQ